MDQTPTLRRPFKEILDAADRSLEDDIEATIPRKAPPAHDPIGAILNERGKSHGEYSDHAAISQAIKRVIQGSKNWHDLSDIQKETLDMTAHKIGRICSGNPDVKDHWDDIAGYNVLVSKRL